jgi:hypothetical protein
MMRTSLLRRLALVASAALLSAACEDEGTGASRPFIADGQVGLVVNSTGKSLTLFRVGNPSETRQIPFGASAAVTPTGLSVQGRRAAVPLGNAASVALVDLDGLRIARFFVFPSGNATGSAFVDDTTLLVANTRAGYVGRVTVGQASDTVKVTQTVAADPTSIVIAGGRAAVVSSNLNGAWPPVAQGVVTFLDPRTLQVQGVVQTGGTNPTDAAVGPDGLLYVTNTGNYSADGSVTIINPQTMQAVATVAGFGAGPGSIRIDASGRAFVSSFGNGTVVWDTRTRTFLRGPDNPVCARLANGRCRGAFDATTDVQGNVYQAFFGSAAQGLPSYVFVYRGSDYALTDSVQAGTGAAAIEVRSF